MGEYHAPGRFVLGIEPLVLTVWAADPICKLYRQRLVSDGNRTGSPLLSGPEPS
jgi:hypothetical protein